MFFLLYLFFTLSIVITWIWQVPAPIYAKVGFGMIAESFAMLLGAGIYWGYSSLMDIYREMMVTLASNCLMWKHPENTPNGIATLELVSYLPKAELENKSKRLQHMLMKKRYFLQWRGIKDEVYRLDDLIKTTVPISGPDWFYKYLWFMPEKRLKWMYEKKEDDGAFNLHPYLPDKEINIAMHELAEKADDLTDKKRGVGYPTTGELAAALDWRAAKRRLRHRKSIADKLATGAVIAMPIVCLLAIMFLLDMLQQNKTGGG